jgi:transposase
MEFSVVSEAHGHGRVGIEACGTSHHWARELIKLGVMRCG